MANAAGSDADVVQGLEALRVIEESVLETTPERLQDLVSSSDTRVAEVSSTCHCT